MIEKKKKFKRGDFDYPLPKKHIAQYPGKKRDDSKLMVVNRKEKTIKHKKYRKYFKVSSQPNSPKEYFVNKGAIKYPTDAAAVTRPDAIVLFSFGKCLLTSETGTLIAVAPKAIPIRTPRLIWK